MEGNPTQNRKHGHNCGDHLKKAGFKQEIEQLVSDVHTLFTRLSRMNPNRPIRRLLCHLCTVKSYARLAGRGATRGPSRPAYRGQ